MDAFQLCHIIYRYLGLESYLVGIILALGSATLIASLLTSTDSVIYKSNISASLLLFLSISLRYVLCRRKRKIQDIIKIIRNTVTYNKKGWKQKRNIIFLCSLVCITPVVACGLTIYFLISNIKGRNMYLYDWCFRMNNTEVGMYATNISLYCSQIMFFIITHFTMNAFALYYTVLCLYTNENFKKIIKTVSLKNFTDLSSCFKMYKLASALVVRLDEVFNFAVFLCFTFVTLSVYYHLTFMLHSPFESSGFEAAMFASLIDGLLILSCMCASASAIHDSSRDVGRSLPSLKSSFDKTEDKYWLIIGSLSGVSMTVWNVIHVTKSFLLGAVGTIFTYSLLIDSL